MKNLTSVLFLFLTLISFSCSIDVLPPTLGQLILGNWKCSEIEVEGTQINKLSELEYLVEGNDTFLDLTFTFSEDPKVVITEGDADVEFRLVLGEEILQQNEFKQKDIIEETAWSIQGEKLVFEDGSEFTNLVIDENQLVMEHKVKTSQMSGLDDMDVTYKFYFEKK